MKMICLQVFYYNKATRESAWELPEGETLVRNIFPTLIFS